MIELLCNYFFPKCTSDTGIVPICEQSCTEHLNTGICADHLLNALMILNTEDFSTVAGNRSLRTQNDCSPSYDITVSNNCTHLTSEYTRKLASCIIDQSIA